MKISFFKFKVFCLFCLIIFKLNLCFSTNKSCTANSPESWIECGSKLKNNQIDTIEITDSILCNPNVNCNLFISNLKRVKIFTNNKSLLSRSGFFQNDFLSFQGIDELILLNLSLDEPQNSPFQEKSGMEEINLSCTESQFGFSELAQSNIQCGSLISVRSSKSVLLDSLQVSNSKQFGFIIHDNLRVILKSSKISNSWLFGIWGGKNKELIFENNLFFKNRSNGFLMDFENSINSIIERNRFISNHYATTFHVCGSGDEPCPGGQIDISGKVQNLNIKSNIFENGKLGLEYPEDKNYDWITAIEFEPHNGSINNVIIENNIFLNHSGSLFYINTPSVENYNKFKIDHFKFMNNQYCNVRTFDLYYGSNFQSQWRDGIYIDNNIKKCTIDRNESNATVKPIGIK